MFLGIEIGGTKLQLGVGRGDGTLVALERYEVRPNEGAEGILGQIEAAARGLIARHGISAIGIGGGLLVEGEIFRAGGHGVAEIGQLRPGLHADRPDQTVESLASGWGIAVAAQARLSDPISHAFVPLTSGLRGAKPDDMRQRLIETEEAEAQYAADLLDRCGAKLDTLTAQMVSQAAGEGNEIAREVLSHACQALGWAIAQTITLVAPEVVVVGGGVSSMDESLFLVPLRLEVDRYVFPPLAGKFQLVPAELGDEVVVHGALAAAAEKHAAGTLR